MSCWDQSVGSRSYRQFPEVVTTYFVARAPQDLGKRVRFLFSWDDYDRFRKVPADVDQAFARYLGMPYSTVQALTDPLRVTRCTMNSNSKRCWRTFEITPDYRYQHENYTSGIYAEQIIHAFRQRHAIYDILSEYKTAAGSDAEREAFYPTTVYCATCGTDATTIDAFDEAKATYHYSCHCGHTATVDMRAEHRMKLNWKVDWAMRWAHEGVDFEPVERTIRRRTGVTPFPPGSRRKSFGNQHRSISRTSSSV
ncbi:hypothetical protein OVA29_13045 [Exiguobacterium sp. SL14]|nr:hypothetical protein [Exiguobacterium sp. SL14]MCY1691499.1 hypothetical protein [Exiguobacterium sp. SL14]